MSFHSTTLVNHAGKGVKSQNQGRFLCLKIVPYFLCGLLIINIPHFLLTMGCLRLRFFQPWVVYGRFSASRKLITAAFHLGLFAADFRSALGCLGLIFTQPWVVYGRFSFNPGLFAVDVLSTLGPLRQILCQPKVVYGCLSFNPALPTVDFL